VVQCQPGDDFEEGSSMTTESGGVFCANCKAPIEGEPPIPDDPAQRKPCSECGSTARMIGLASTAKISSTVTATATIIPYSETLLAKTKEFIARGDFSIAVVVAHMACEISAERAISRAVVEKGIEYLQDSIFGSYSLASERIRKIYNALTGVEIQKQAFWPAYKESVTRRNNSVHRGATVTKAEAEATYKAANDLVSYLKA
jgi:hypothetical protein